MSTWIGIPFLSAFLFVMGGILVGHLLWYRDRSRDLQAVKEAESKYSKAKAAARDRKHQFIDLSRDAKTYQQQCEDYQQEVDSLRQSLAKEKQHVDFLQTEMDKLHSEHSRYELACRDAQEQRDTAIDQAEDAAAELERLQELLRDTQTRAQQSSNKMNELASAAEMAGSEIGRQQSRTAKLTEENDKLEEQLQTLRAQLAQTESMRDQLQDERDQLLQQRDDNAREFGQLTSRGEQIAIEIEELRQRCDELTLLRDEAIEQRDQAIGQRDQFATQRDQLATERDTASAQFDETDEKYIELQKEYAALRDQYEVAIAANQNAETQQEEMTRLQQALSESTVKVETLQSEHDELLEQLDDRTARIQTAIDGRVTAETALSTMESRVEGLQAELAAANQIRSQHELKLKEIHASTTAIRTQTQELTDQLSNKDQRIEELRKQIAEQDEAIIRHRAELQRLNSVRPEFEKLKETVVTKSAALAKAEVELRSWSEQKTKLQNEIERREVKIAGLSTEQQQIRVQVADQTEVIGRLRRELHNAATQLESAKQFELQAVAMKKKSETMQARSEDLQRQLERVSAELEASLDANAAMQDRIRQIEGQLHENAIAMRDLRRKRANVPTLNSVSSNEHRDEQDDKHRKAA